MKPKLIFWIICMLALLLAGCQTPTTAPSPVPSLEPTQAQIANPASENCIAQGGTLEITTRGDGGQYGICYFEDNRQCEEWALLRGDCPAGGLKVTGYITPAAQYCAITGGTYTITGNSGSDDEQGDCTFNDGSLCNAWDYYNGKCSPGTVISPTPAAVTIQPLSMEVCDGQAQAMTHTLDVLVGTPPDAPFIATQSEEPLDDFVNNASGTGCMATVTGTGAQFESPTAVVVALGGMLVEQGWMADPMLVADGPTGTSAGYRKDNQICWAGAIWMPDESANCPQDQPITTCQLTPEQQVYTATLNCGVETLPGQAASPTELPLVGGGATQLVFDSTRGSGYRDLFVMNTNGEDIQRLTEGDSNTFAGPWSPDGQRIAFTGFGLTNSYIALINADGSGQTILSQVEGSDEGFPDWSPDGSQIAFTSRRDGNNEIYVTNADGSNPVRLTNSPTDDFAPSWSPDGTQIVFVSDRDREAGIYDLYIMNADGSGITRLTDDTAIDYSPDWSPDGRMIIFRSHHDGAVDIYMINVDGSGLVNLTNNPADDWAPQWSPDGTYIAFQTNRDGNWEIYIMTADGSNPLNLTDDPGDDQMPFWRP